jgi:acyl-[acyl-carrier-protein]-phospholipid O-acyltransferase/long-chain-fatty-acid--[acyl-carrier-protein] ligase
MWQGDMPFRNGHAGQSLAVTGLAFVIPSILLASYTGQVADRFSKAKGLRLAKASEVLVLALSIPALHSRNLSLLLCILCLLAIRIAFLSPAQSGLIPGMLPTSQLSRANGLIGAASFAAMILGSSLGSFLMAIWEWQRWINRNTISSHCMHRLVT